MISYLLLQNAFPGLLLLPLLGHQSGPLNYMSHPFILLCLITNITEFLLGAHSWMQSAVRFALATYAQELLAVVSSLGPLNRTTNGQRA